MLSRNLEQSLHRALALATERNHEYATLEHLLLALTDDQDGISVLRACGVEVEKLRLDLTSFIDDDLGDLVTAKLSEPKPTAGFQRVVQRAAIHVQSIDLEGGIKGMQQGRVIGIAHVLGIKLPIVVNDLAMHTQGFQGPVQIAPHEIGHGLAEITLGRGRLLRKRAEYQAAE